MTQEHTDPHLHAEEMRQKREAWFAEKKRKAEEERVAGLRQEMEAYREERLRDWMAHGGDPDDFDRQWPEIMRSYLDTKQIERDLTRAERFAESEHEHYSF